MDAISSVCSKASKSTKLSLCTKKKKKFLEFCDALKTNKEHRIMVRNSLLH